MIKALIVDDEQHNRENLLHLLTLYCTNIQVVALAENVNDAIILIQKHDPQIVFLDIEMPNQTGFDLLRLLTEVHFKIIFVTAHTHYAIKAIKFSALDYLLKPVDTDDLIAAVERAKIEIHNSQNLQNKSLIYNLNNASTPKITVSVKGGLVFLDPSSIIRLEAEGSYTHIFIVGETYITSKNIKEYEELFSDFSFFRVHKSHLVNLKMVKRFSNVDGNYVFMNDGSKAEVSRRKQEQFLEAMRNRN